MSCSTTRTRYTTARFKISRVQADEELRTFAHADAYKAMARTFHEYWP